MNRVRTNMLGKTIRILASKRALVPLLLILIATSAAFTLSATLLFSLQGVESNMLGESAGVVLVSQGNSRTPVTGALPIALINNLMTIGGVSSVSPEVLAPTMTMNKSLIVRGVDPERFILLDNPTILSGRLVTINDSTGVMIGKTLASQLGVHVGSDVSLVGVLSPTIIQVRIIGIFQTHQSFDDEVIAPIWIAQWLRGFAYNTVTIFRIKVDPGQNPSHIIQEIRRDVSSDTFELNQSSSVLPLLPTSISPANLHQLDLAVSQSTSNQFLSSALGLNEETMWLIAGVVFFSMSIAVIYSLQELVSTSKQELDTLRVLGMSSRRLGTSLMIFSSITALVAALAGALAGLAIILAIPNLNHLTLLFYTIDPLNYATQSILASVALTVVEMIGASILSATQFGSIAYEAMSETRALSEDLGGMETWSW